MKCVICGDPGLKSRLIFETMKELEDYDIVFTCIDWREDLSLEQFYSEILRIEHLGAEGVEPFKELIDVIPDADFLIVHFAPVSKNVISNANKLQMIGCIRGGYENINIDAAKEKGIAFFNAPERSTGAVADFTIGLICCLVRRIPEFAFALKNGIWKTVDRKDMPYNLENKTLGLIGFGNIGRAVAYRAKGFGVKILVFDPFVKEASADLNAQLVDLDTVLKESDIISVHARLSPATKHMIGEPQFRSMKKTAFFINTARSGLVDEKALLKALEDKWITGAAIDVFDKEPLHQGSKLMKLDNVLITPHMAGSTIDTFLNGPRIMTEQIKHIISK
ncbi:2-hydroxyacid dehydrogenase [[Eubacterium] cellulosolvens]